MKKTKGNPKSPKHQPDEVTEFAFDAREMPTLASPIEPGEEPEPEKPIKPISRGKVSKKIVKRLIEAVERL